MKNVALITGASSGIGKALAEIHAASGDLVIIARSEDELNALKNELEVEYNSTILVIVKDLTVENAPKEVFDHLKRKNIEVEYLINNAGFGGVGKFVNRKLEEDLAMIQLNVMALTSLTRLFLPEMLERNSGKILNISSIASLMPGPNQATYFATKAYVTSFSQAIAGEVADSKVSVTALLPGATKTNFGKVSGMDKTMLFNNPASVNEVAKEGYKAMMKGKLVKKTGIGLSQKIMLLLLPLIPKRILLSTVKKMQQ
ncbi:SDR family NAD(P)-dependent oxidoreductase [Mesonia aquimarina]|uniref:SDR family NAD(P)-dependent oxidoreductase n=1 Tax=Mesonia aquimarina TaxID=1504967 RepID=UPI000EF5F7E8|nr:SDR family oxidoreductase [Mesonia aquimarina]